jgi:YD repeat-containing protein
MGDLTQVSNANATTSYVSIDPFGRVTASNQEAGGATYRFTYAYNLAGALTRETYPSGRVISTGYDGANRVSAVTGSGTNYVGGAWYWPHGAAGYYQTGSGVAPNKMWLAFAITRGCSRARSMRR